MAALDSAGNRPVQSYQTSQSSSTNGSFTTPAPAGGGAASQGFSYSGTNDQSSGQTTSGGQSGLVHPLLRRRLAAERRLRHRPERHLAVGGAVGHVLARGQWRDPQRQLHAVEHVGRRLAVQQCLLSGLERPVGAISVRRRVARRGDHLHT